MYPYKTIIRFFGWFITRDLSRDKFNITKIIYGIAVIFLFGFLDEVLQLLLPYGIGDLRDIVFNLAGGLWGMGLFFIKAAIRSGNKMRAL